MTRPFIALAAAVLFVVPAGGQEKFTIKIRKDAKGDILKATENDAETGKMSFTVMGKTTPKDEQKTFVGSYTDEILEKEPGKRASKIRRTFSKAEVTRGDQKITPDFVGKEILVERTGMGFKFTIGGKEVTGTNAQILNELFRDKAKEEEDAIEDLLLPKNSVAVNEAWKADVAKLATDMAKQAPFVIDADKSTCTGKLLKAYQKDGRQYGQMQIDAKLVLSKFKAGPVPADLEEGSAINIKFTFDGCIDGSRSSGRMDIAMNIKMAGAIKTPDGFDVKVDMNMKKDASKTQEQEK